MFVENSKTYKLVPGVQVVGNDFVAGYIVEELRPNGTLACQYFSSLTKPKLLDKIKEQNGFKTQGEQIIDKILEGIE